MAIFAWLMRSFGPPSRSQVDYHLDRGGMLLHDAVGVKCGSGATTKIKEHRCLVCGLKGVCWVIVWA